MRNQANKIALSPVSELISGSAANHDWFFWNFSEGATSSAATSVSDKSGVSSQALVGTTAGVWANPGLGITPAVDTAFQINSVLSSADASARAERLYKFDGNTLNNDLIYIMTRFSVAGSPATDTSNNLLSFGRRGSGVDPYGQIAFRISTGRIPQLELRKRGENGTLVATASNSALTLGVPKSYCCILSQPNTTDLEVEWRVDGSLSLSNSGVVTGGLAAGPLSVPEAGIVLLGKGSVTSPFGPSVYIGAGTVAPIVHWIGIGRCADTAANREALLTSWQHLHQNRELPPAFARIGA